MAKSDVRPKLKPAHTGDLGTFAWAKRMTWRRELCVRTTTGVVVGPVNSVGLSFVIVGSKPVLRKNVLSVRDL